MLILYRTVVMRTGSKNIFNLQINVFLSSPIPMSYGLREHFLCQVNGFSLTERIWSSAIWEEFEVELLLPHIQRSQLRWFGRLAWMPPAGLLVKLLQAIFICEEAISQQILNLHWPRKTVVSFRWSRKKWLEKRLYGIYTGWNLRALLVTSPKQSNWAVYL